MSPIPLLLSLALAAEPAKPIPTRPDDDQPYRPYDMVPAVETLLKPAEQAVRDRPNDAEAWARLAQLQHRRARETGDLTGYERAEAAARKAVALDAKSPSGRASLAVALAARHAFRDALALARELARELPTDPGPHVIASDALLELGDLDAAEAELAQAVKREARLATLSRKARFAEVRGRNDEALRLMTRADEEESGTAGTRAARAWFKRRRGEMLFQAGRLPEAVEQLKAALALYPDDSAALALLGRVTAAQGQTEEGIALLSKAVARYPDLAMLADLGDLYALSGNTFLAQLNYQQFEKAALREPVSCRELAKFYADHQREPARAEELAKRDVADRPDVGGYDTLAWALCRAGQYEAAAEAMTKARRWGTQDAALLFHAGMIEHGRGQREAARDLLTKALALNPHFSPLLVPEAKRVLAER